MRLHEFFSAIGEHYAAGYFRQPNASYLSRHAHALAEVLTKGPLPTYAGTRLYPQGRASIWHATFDTVFSFCYYHTSVIRRQPAYDVCVEKGKNVGIRLDATLGRQLQYAIQDKAFQVSFLRGWTHSVIDYERILHDGLDAYVERLERDLPQHPDFCQPLLEVLGAIQTHIQRCEQHLRQAGAEELADIFAHMAHHPAENLRQAFVYFNYFWFIDDPDSAGRMDAVLEQYEKNLSDDEITAHFREFWQSFDALSVWNVTFDTHLPWMHFALPAQRHLSRPGASALIDEDTPQQAWDDIFDAWLGGNTSPALYYRPNYYQGLGSRWNVQPEDFHGLSYGGCTEVMIMGKSNVGSTDGDVHALNILSSVNLFANTFEDFYQNYLAAIRTMAKQEVDRCELGHHVAAMYQPNIIRTLFTQDCIEQHREFNAGGARYNLGLIGVTGLSNAVNAVCNIKLAYDGQFSLKRLHEALESDFQNDPELLEMLKATPKFGNDHEATDALATRLIDDIFAIIHAESRPERTYIPFINLFTTYAERGSYIPATADGRRSGAPVADSFGAVQGTDVSGPTALLNSLTKPDQLQALGTPVFNLRLQREMLTTPQARELTKAMLMTYFKRGGLQVQVSVLDAEAMKDALEHPENHPHLMVRIGGYSEYFTRLSRPVQLEVIKRTEHSL